MDLLKNIGGSAHSKKEVSHKDKLAETKKAEREIKEAAKHQREEEKAKKEQARHEEAHAYKELRAISGESKRAAKEQREALKKDAKKESGSMCEHGVWKCRICNPIDHHK